MGRKLQCWVLLAIDIIMLNSSRQTHTTGAAVIVALLYSDS